MGTSPLSHLSGVLRRQVAHLGDNLLLVNPPAGLVESLSPRCSRLVLFSQEWADYRHLQNLENETTTAVYAASLPTEFSGFDHAIVFLARAKALTRMLVHLAAERVRANGRVWLLGENKAGIKSSGRAFDAHFAARRKIDAARHCVLFEATRQDDPPPFRLSEYQSRQHVETAHGKLELIYLPGVFARDRLDPGTQLLLANLPPLQGRVLDFGCGAGVIGLSLKCADGDVDITAADSSALALHATEQSFALANQPVQTIACDGPHGLTGPYDAIVSNPPFHRGIHTDYGVTEAWLSATPSLLRSGGTLFFVANRFIDYAGTLEASFDDWQVLADNGRFRVYRARRR